jgi:hypothetical protein
MPGRSIVDDILELAPKKPLQFPDVARQNLRPRIGARRVSNAFLLSGSGFSIAARRLNDLFPARPPDDKSMLAAIALHVTPF